MALTLPTKRKTWQFAGQSAAVTDGSLGTSANYRTLLFDLHTKLLAFGFEVAISCDSTQVSTSADLWVDIGDIVFAGNGQLSSGSNHSWVVWEHPNGSQLCFDCNSGANGRIASLNFSPGGNFTGGTTQQRAQASDEVGAGRADGNFNNWAGNATGSFEGWVVVCHSDDDELTRVFVWNADDNSIEGAMGWEVLADPQGAFVNKLFWWGGGGVEFSGENYMTTSDNQRFLVGRDNAGTVFTLVGSGIGFVPSGNALDNRLSDANIVAGTTFQAETGSPTAYPFVPVFAVDDTGGVLGELQDFFFGNEAAPVAATSSTVTYPASTTERTWWHRTALIQPWTEDATLAFDQTTNDTATGYAIGGQGAVAGPTGVAPVVSNFSPANGSALGAQDPIFFDTTDVDADLGTVFVWADPGDGGLEVVYAGGQFVGAYAQLSNTASIVNGLRFEVRRSPSWASPAPGESVAVRINVAAVDATGNEAV